MKRVMFIGCSKEQATFAGCRDPRRHLEIYGVYILEKEEVHKWHTRYFLKGYESLPFNSVCFETVDG